MRFLRARPLFFPSVEVSTLKLRMWSLGAHSAVAASGREPHAIATLPNLRPIPQQDFVHFFADRPLCSNSGMPPAMFNCNQQFELAVQLLSPRRQRCGFVLEAIVDRIALRSSRRLSAILRIINNHLQ